MSDYTIAKNELCELFKQKKESIINFNSASYVPSDNPKLSIPSSSELWICNAGWIETDVKIEWTPANADNTLYMTQGVPDSIFNRVEIVNTSGSSQTLLNAPNMHLLHSSLTDDNFNDISTKQLTQNYNEWAHNNNLPNTARSGSIIIEPATGGVAPVVTNISTTTSLSHLSLFGADLILPLAYLGNGREALTCTFSMQSLRDILYVEGTDREDAVITNVTFSFKYHMITIIPTAELQLKMAKLVQENKFLFPLDAYNSTTASCQAGTSQLTVRLNVDEESVKKLIVIAQRSPSDGLSDTYDPNNTFSSGSIKSIQLRVGTMTYPQTAISRKLNAGNIRDANNFMKEVSTALYDYQDRSASNIITSLYHDPDSDPTLSGQFKAYISLDSGCESIYSGTNVRELGSNIDCDIFFGNNGAFDGVSNGTITLISQQTNMYLLQLDGLRKITKAQYYELVARLNVKDKDLVNEINSVSGVQKA
jgi:hypothetical protein